MGQKREARDRSRRELKGVGEEYWTRGNNTYTQTPKQPQERGH